jgi:DNA-binding XRE family transcriptional regulator
MEKNIQRAVKQNQKNVLARLREVIGGSQKSAPDDLGIATDTCASIESGRARMTPTIARRVESWTGVSGKCLLKGSTKLTTPDGKPYTRDIFDRICFERDSVIAPVRNKGNESFRLYLLLCMKLGCFMLAAADANDGKFAAWKLRDEIIRAGRKYPAFESKDIVHGVVKTLTAPEVFNLDLQNMLNAGTLPTKLWANILDRFHNELCAIENSQARAAAIKTGKKKVPQKSAKAPRR